MASQAALELLIKLNGANEAGREMDNLGKKGGGLGDIFKTGLAIAGGAVLGLGAALVGATMAAADEEKGIARLNKTLKNAIPNWDGNTDAVEAYISKQEQLGFADDQLRDSLNLLVNQTGSLTEAQTLQTDAMNLARFGNIDLEKATRLLLKADDESYAALGKLGIQIDSNATKEQALTAIRQASAGQAEAYANTTAGAMERIQNTIGNVIEDIGGAILPLVEGPLQAFADWFQSPEVQAGIQAIATLIGETLVGAFGFFQNAINIIMPIIQPFVDAIGNFFSTISGGGDIMGALGGYFNDLGLAVQNAWNIVAPALGTLLGNIVQWIKDNGPTILTNLLTWAQAFGTWVWQDAIPVLLTELGKLISTVWTWITDNGPGILTQLGVWAQQFGSWVWDIAIPALLAGLGGLIEALWQFIVDNGPTILAKLAEWTGAFFKWVWDEVVVKLPGWLWGIAQAVWDWVVKNGPLILAELAVWTKAFWDWTVDVATNLPTHLAPIATTIWNWITGVNAGVGVQTQAMSEHFASMPHHAVTKLNQPTGLPAITFAIMKWAHETTMGALKWLWDTGVNLVTGLWNGFAVEWQRFVAKVAQLVAAFVAIIQRALKISSPSQVMADEVGKPLAQGIGWGFAQDWPGVSTGIVTMINGMVGTLASDFAELKGTMAADFPQMAAIVETMKGAIAGDFAEVQTAVSNLKGQFASDFPEISRLAAVLASDLPQTLAPLHQTAADIGQAFHDLATSFAASMAAMTAAYNAMKSNVETGVSVGTTTVYNGNNGETPIPGGGGGSGPPQRVLGSVRAGGIVGAGVGGGSSSGTSITIGPITIYAGLGANGRDIADEVIDEIENRLGQRIFSRNPGLASVG